MIPGKLKTVVLSYNQDVKISLENYYEYQIINTGTSNVSIRTNGTTTRTLSPGDSIQSGGNWRFNFNEDIEIDFSGAGTNNVEFTLLKIEKYPNIY